MQHFKKNTIFKFISIILFVASLSFAQTGNELDLLNVKLGKAKISKDTLNITRAYFKLGKYLSYNDISKSFLYLDSALAMAKNIHNVKAISLISNVIAANYSDHGEHDKAIKIYKNVADYFISKDQKDKAAAILLNTGLELSSIGKYSEAMEKEILALEMLVSSGDSTNIADYFCEIGILFNKLDNKVKYEEYVLKAYFLMKNVKYADFYSKTNILNELAYIYQTKGDLLKSLDVNNQNYILSKNANYLNGMAVSLSNMAEIERELNNYDKALEYYKQSYKLNKSNRKTSGIIYSASHLGELYSYKKEYTKAKIYLNEALNLSNGKHYSEELKLTLKLLSDLYVKQGNYKLSIKYLQKYLVVKDSLENIAVKKQFAKLETQYDKKQKEKKIELLNKENQLKKEQLAKQLYLFAAVFVFLLLISALIYWTVRNKKIKAERDSFEYRQKMLRSQLNPHFIFNSLNAIQNYILKSKTFESADYLSDFARLMRLILESSREDLITIEKEKEMMEYYLKLQQLRFSNVFSFNIDVDANIDMENTEIPSMLLQPFIENAIEHGIKNSRNSDGKIEVIIKKESNHIKLSVKDNGKGFSTEKKSKHKSYAIQITKERLENIYILNKQKIKFEINSDKQLGTTVCFKMPANRKGIKID